MPKSTPEQLFTKIYNLANDPAAPEHDSAKRKMVAWLKRHGKTERDYPAIFAKAAADDIAQQPPPPPSDPRDAAPHPFDDPNFTPAGLVEGMIEKYVWMSEHVRIIYALSIIFTHVYLRFAIAPRVALVSGDPDSGKTTALEVGRHLAFRPNPESFATGAAVGEFLDEGPGSVFLDEVDQGDRESQRRLGLVWNLGHKRGTKRSMVIGGKRKLVSLHAPMFAAGISGFLATTQRTRTLVLEMQQYTEETKPEREYTTEEDFTGFDAVYSFIRHWVVKAKLDPRPAMPPGVIRRNADNVRGLLSIADACGSKWGQRAREAIVALFEKEKAERPQELIIRHGLVIFDRLGVDEIRSTRFNRELKQLDLPDANWTRYRGASGADYAHPITMFEQSGLLGKGGVHSIKIRPPGEKQCHGYKRVQFEEAVRKYGATPPDDAEPGRGRLRLITPRSD